MLIKTITYKDFDENDITEDFCFNLSKAELAEWILVQGGDDLQSQIRKLIENNERAKLLEVFRNLITQTVGRRSEDGKRFIKSKEITDEFMQTNAYSELFMQLASDAGAAVEFINGVVPKDLREMAEALGKTETVELPASEEPKTIDDYTDDELLTMSSDEFKKLVDSLPGKNIPRRVLQIGMRRGK